MKRIRQLDMELAGGCNYSCQMCPQGFEGGREKEFKKNLPHPLVSELRPQVCPLVVGWASKEIVRAPRAAA